ncbi:hypothetical protein ARMGADRAFT_1075048 [Armillaria gallica]|uniref:Uncharacterized protein n=1 Tax=Armillaria gallica TaxID=47427 RepID=A0A2H3EFJ9_ARMGA|nr:hypothetical protein ARMGADRAFT_1075048 [Armillaria gallica]
MLLKPSSPESAGGPLCLEVPAPVATTYPIQTSLPASVPKSHPPAVFHSSEEDMNQMTVLLAPYQFRKVMPAGRETWFVLILLAYICTISYFSLSSVSQRGHSLSPFMMAPQPS